MTKRFLYGIVSWLSMGFLFSAYAVNPITLDLDDVPGDTPIVTNVVPWVQDYVSSVAGVTPSLVTNIASSASVTNAGAVNLMEGRYLRKDMDGTVAGAVTMRGLSLKPVDTTLGTANVHVLSVDGVSSIGFFFGLQYSWLIPDMSAIVTSNMMTRATHEYVNTNGVVSLSLGLITQAFGTSVTNASGQRIANAVLLKGQGSSDVNKVYQLKVVDGELGIEEVQ